MRLDVVREGTTASPWVLVDLDAGRVGLGLYATRRAGMLDAGRMQRYAKVQAAVGQLLERAIAAGLTGEEATAILEDLSHDEWSAFEQVEQPQLPDEAGAESTYDPPGLPGFAGVVAVPRLRRGAGHDEQGRPTPTLWCLRLERNPLRKLKDHLKHTWQLWLLAQTDGILDSSTSEQEAIDDAPVQARRGSPPKRRVRHVPVQDEPVRGPSRRIPGHPAPRGDESPTKRGRVEADSGIGGQG